VAAAAAEFDGEVIAADEGLVVSLEDSRDR
jgi:hypothetical protein